MVRVSNKIVIIVFLLSLVQGLYAQEQQSDNLVVTIEPVDAAHEKNTYFFHKSSPFKIKITLENTASKSIKLLSPRMQNDFIKILYFQLASPEGSIISADVREISMYHCETVGPKIVALQPRETVSFYAYLNSDQHGIEEHHFVRSDVFDSMPEGHLFHIIGIYDTRGYKEIDYYKDIDEIFLQSNHILIKVIQ